MGEKLMDLMRARGETIPSLAKKIGMDRTTLWRKVTGQREFTVSEAKRIVGAMHIEKPAELFLSD